MINSKHDLYAYINQMCGNLGIRLNKSYPLDTIHLCSQIERINLQYHQFETPGFCAAVLLGDKTDTIILNSNRNSIERRFDCGHELIHIYKHRNTRDYFSCMERGAKDQKHDSFYEWEANEGAAEMLVPYQLLLPKIKQAHPHLNSRINIYDFSMSLAREFCVSEAVIQYRYESLKYEIWQYLNGVALYDIKIMSKSQQSICGIDVPSINDKLKALSTSELEEYIKQRDTNQKRRKNKFMLLEYSTKY